MVNLLDDKAVLTTEEQSTLVTIGAKVEIGGWISATS
jgi:hypothetical protein